MTPEQTEVLLEEYVAMNRVEESDTADRRTVPVSDILGMPHTQVLDADTGARLKAEMQSKLRKP